MSASSLTFLGFAIIAALLHAAWSNTVWRKLLMLAANLAFVLSFTTSAKALMPLACFLVLGYVAVCAARFQTKGLSESLYVLGTLAIFCWLKKYWFLSFVPFLPFVYLTVGLSYTFFRVMGMIVDARSDERIAKVGPVSFFNFAMNFPTMIAGPIDRYEEFSDPPTELTQAHVAVAFERIALGFFKVLVLSTFVSRWQTGATAALMEQGTQGRLIAHAAASFGLYPIFLYFNFSGYTDIVLGIGKLFGKTYPENFNAPFSSYNFLDFWSRWHMSLSFWLRDYVYTPLLKLLMQVNLPRSIDPYLGVACYFVTFFLIGIWHGSTAIFAVYGLLLGLGVSVNKAYQIVITKRLGKKRYKELSANLAYRFVCRGLTYTWYSFCMICFWNTGLVARHYVHLLGFADMAAAFVALLMVVTVALNLFEEAIQLREFATAERLGEYAPYLRSIAVALMIFACIANAVVTQKINADIIYQAF